MATTFRDSELTRVRNSGWVRNPRIRELTEAAGLPGPAGFLAEALTVEQWVAVQQAAVGLRERFGGYRFAEATEFGILLVPQPGRLDTRTAIPAAVRTAQHAGLGEDFLDAALPAGADLTSPDVPWTLFVSVVGSYGIAAGSYNDITNAPVGSFTVGGYDTRTAMIRQLWGARLLQAPPGTVPDSDYNDVWTFTLFPGESLIGQRAVSGTVLKGRVRFRLGKTNRGIGSARVAPAVPVLGYGQPRTGNGGR